MVRIAEGLHPIRIHTMLIFTFWMCRSLLIRYPYELTLRGVLKYQLFPYINSKTYSARVCKIMQIDPATGSIEEVPLPEQSICDEA